MNMSDEIWRISHECEGRGQELITQGLTGREKNVENVTKLWKLVRLVLGGEEFASIGCKCGSTKWWPPIEEFLRSSGWTEEQLNSLRFPDPKPGSMEFRSILDEMEAEERS